MGTRAMKLDLFTIKAVESKGYNIQELIQQTDEELDTLPLSMKLIEAIKIYKQRGGKTAEEIAEEIADIMLKEDSLQHNVAEVASEYKTNTDEQQDIIEEIQSSVVIPEDEVQIVRAESSQEDIDTITEALKEKDFKSFASAMKHLKTAVPSQILTSVDGATVSGLIDARIAEVKAVSEKD